MKKLILGAFLIISSLSCKRMAADYESRLHGVQKVCPKCSYVLSEGRYYAVDTCKQPNIIYIVTFKAGGWLYTASDVDHLTRVN